MDREDKPFRVLLAEDDTVSREYLGEALRSCGAAVTACADGRSALAQALASRWDLLLLDYHLPGLTGAEVLSELDAAGGTAPRATAIAMTAAADEKRDELLRAGFVEVLPKPIATRDLYAALRRHGCPSVTLDDGAALQACGSTAIIGRLRRLFAEQELPAILAEFDQCNGDLHKLRPALHRLQASCGFCGATSLASAGESLQRALAQADAGGVEAAAAAFRSALVATRRLVLTSLSPEL